jgi:hypothetical protein
LVQKEIALLHEPLECPRIEGVATDH